MEHTGRLRFGFFIALALFIGGTLSMTAYTLWLLRADAIKNGLEISALLSRSFGDHLTQSIHVTELAGVNAVSSENVQTNSPHAERDFVSVLRNSPYLRSMSLLDESGHIIVSSNRANIGLAVATSSYLPVTNGPQSVVRIGQPWAGRDFADGQESSHQSPVNASASFIPLTQGLATGSGRMTLLIALNPDYFLHHMSDQFDAKAGSVEVLRLDGTLLMNTDPQASVGGLRHLSGRLLQFNEAESGQFEQDLGNDNHALSAFRVSSQYPFVVITHVQRERALQNWRYEAKTIVAIVIPALLALSLLAIAFYRRQLLLEAQRAKSERLQQINAARVFTNSHEGIIITNFDGTIVDVNDAFAEITGYGRDEVLGKNPSLLSSGRQDKAFYTAMWRDLVDHGVWRGEIWNRRKDGELFAEKLTISAVRDDHGIVRQYVGLLSDISQRKQMEEQVRQLAFYDPLTRLPNRRLLSDRLSLTMATSKRSGLYGALMFLDLDNFKPLNDEHGHGVGDSLLMEVARRLTTCVREVDTVARFGGDEFVVLLGELDESRSVSTEQARIVAEKIRLSLSAPHCLLVQKNGAPDSVVEHHCSASIGVALFIDHEASQDDVLKWADATMYQAKDAGRNLIRFYQAEGPA